MDFGDWQELSRLRFENHAWHRCITTIIEALDKPGARADSIAQAVEQSVHVLNQDLVTCHRRPVASQG
jgi:hypothetical protein